VTIVACRFSRANSKIASSALPLADMPTYAMVVIHQESMAGTEITMKRLATTLSALLVTNAAAAHHSFAVFFNTEDKAVKVTGVVKDFQFSNPHGVITLVVLEGSDTTIWRAETNSPSILRRRGWTPDSIHVGDKVTLEGWPARDGSNYIRLRAAWQSDGQLIGQPLVAPVVKP
jgi:Family of unknown function (DUF6152)